MGNETWFNLEKRYSDIHICEVLYLGVKKHMKGLCATETDLVKCFATNTYFITTPSLFTNTEVLQFSLHTHLCMYA